MLRERISASFSMSFSDFRALDRLAARFILTFSKWDALRLRVNPLAWLRMRTALQLSALAIGFISAVFWLFGGPNFGRTRTVVAQSQIDPRTNQEQIVHISQINPGIDFLIVALGASAALYGISFLIRRQASRPSH